MSEERTTYRERRLAKADRLRDWAEKREEKSEAAHRAAHDATAMIPFGQPILVGHHSERRHRKAIERGDNAMRSAIENGRKAEEMESRADEIERQAANAIYSDDPDAIEQLQAKIERLEAEREAIKVANAEYRKAHRAELKALTAYGRDQALPYPSYVGQNLSGNIGRLRKRLEQLQREAVQGPRDRIISAKYGGTCADCGAEIERGQQIRYNRAAGARCVSCEGTSV